MEEVLSEFFKTEILDNLDRTSNEIDRILDMMDGIKFSKIVGEKEDKPKNLKKPFRLKKAEAKTGSSMIKFERYL